MQNDTDITPVAQGEQRVHALREPQAASDPQPAWARLLMPSVADLIFLATFWFLTCGLWAQRLLGDADTGWHIRNGEHILTTHTAPRADYFSYTMAGHPWYAWEWLYDAVIGWLHAHAGLNGVVVVSALLIALTLTVLFQMTLRRSGNLLVSAALTLVTAAAASIHFLARPHLVTWLFVLVWYGILDRHRRDGNWKRLVWIPVLMVLWVNLHGGFLLGLVLPVLFAIGHLAGMIGGPSREERSASLRAAQQLSLVTVVAFAATLMNPYGWRLYSHLREYLGSRFMMNTISEFQSPDFHYVQAKFFAALLLLSLVALIFSRSRTPVDLLLVCFSAWTALYSARNIPIASILLVLTCAPMLAHFVSDAREDERVSFRVRRLLTSFEDFSARMHGLEKQFRAHTLAIVVVAATAAIAFNGGRVFSRTVLDLNFDAKQMPAGACDYLSANRITKGVFTEDAWGGFLIYRLHPGLRVFIDDRHDFYGENFLREYLQAVKLGPEWRNVLDKYSISYALIPPDSPLASALRESGDWKVIYRDATSVLYSRGNAPAGRVR